MAAAHSILIIAYHLIQRQEPYRELGGDYFDKQRPEATAKRLVQRIERLGYAVMLQQLPTPGAASAIVFSDQLPMPPRGTKRHEK